MPLSRSVSVYLDLLRVAAAFAVLLNHMTLDGISMAWLPLSGFSHEAVIVFFVLSGYIIHATTVGRGRTAGDFFVARASRIYSVAIPAIVLSVVLGWVAMAHPAIDAPALINWVPTDGWDIVSSMVFLNQSWANDAAVALNAPYWSLCYEVWYYILFGIVVFARGALRWTLAAAAAAIAGPAVLVLFPVWLLGVALSKYGGRVAMPAPVAGMVLLGSVAAIALIDSNGFNVTVRDMMKGLVPGFWRLDHSQQCVTDYMIALLIGANILAFGSIGPRVRCAVLRLERPVRYMAGFTFSLYLFHRPFTQIAGQVFPNPGGEVVHGIAVASAITAICLGLSYLSERRLGHWRSGIERLVAPRAGTGAAIGRA